MARRRVGVRYKIRDMRRLERDARRLLKAVREMKAAGTGGAGAVATATERLGQAENVLTSALDAVEGFGG